MDRGLLARLTREGAGIARAAAVRARLLPYRPEDRSATEWSRAYEGGHLDYYGRLDELGRYSVTVGYIAWFLREHGARHDATVLDIGCGTGLLRARLEGLAFERYVGVDLSERAVAVARAAGVERSEYLAGDVMSDALALEPADVVVLNEVLYYAPEPRSFLQRVAQLTAPGGIVVISVWRHRGDTALWREVADVLELVDRVRVRNDANPVNRRGWIVACCRPRG